MIKRLRSLLRPRRCARTAALTVLALMLTPISAPAASQQETSPAPAPQTHILNENSDLCLNLFGSLYDPGTRTEVWHCNELQSEKWEYRSDSGTIFNPYSGMCLNLYGSLTEPGTPTEIWGCDTEKFPGEIWEWKDDGTLYNPYAEQCLGVAEGSTEPGARTVIWPCDVDQLPAQKWVAFNPSS